MIRRRSFSLAAVTTLTSIVSVTCFLTTTPTYSTSPGAVLRERHHVPWALQARLTSEEIQSRLENQLAKLKVKDRTSVKIPIDELNIAFEDNHIIVIDKPSGVLCVSNDPEVSSLAQSVFARCQTQKLPDVAAQMDQIVVHRLGMDTSGLIVFAKTMRAVRGMHAAFRNRKVTREYEALVCGHVAKDEGVVNLPLMHDYEHPPYMRVSTDEHQGNLVDLDPDIVGRRLLEAPKASLTHYQVVARESLRDNEDLPVTRLILTSVTGRTHQLNVHCAAIGHPIVRDAVYGYNGEAAPGGGLVGPELPLDQASEDLQQRVYDSTSGMNMCVHAKYIRLKHPITKEIVEVTSPSPF